MRILAQGLHAYETGERSRRHVPRQSNNTTDSARCPVVLTARKSLPFPVADSGTCFQSNKQSEDVSVLLLPPGRDADLNLHLPQTIASEEDSARELAAPKTRTRSTTQQKAGATVYGLFVRIPRRRMKRFFHAKVQGAGPSEGERRSRAETLSCMARCRARAAQRSRSRAQTVTICRSTRALRRLPVLMTIESRFRTHQMDELLVERLRAAAGKDPEPRSACRVDVS
ncbi:hypothetical protein LshimejAT787_1602690 [Lyophyllum shimeji]|uniref:Uncharacterized protein n=1 Tax=Lyophyllum shimeji TaxID=47721 RepID=A0A9P3PZG9_LYOSH|nr:hypothetical protein LshimejAT787_1602690 [Lyophyllum shimeji]